MTVYEEPEAQVVVESGVMNFAEDRLSYFDTRREYAPRYEMEYCVTLRKYFPVRGHVQSNDPDELELVLEKEASDDTESVDA